jgi:hypothetical protein
MTRWFLAGSALAAVVGGLLLRAPAPPNAHMADAQAALRKSAPPKRARIQRRMPPAAREITALGQNNHVIGPDHYQRLDQQLHLLAAQDYPAHEIRRLRAILERLNPARIAETDRKNEGARQNPPSAASGCSTDRPVLTHDFTNLSAIREITAPGSPAGEKDIAKGHFWVWTGGERVPIYAPIDAILESITSGPAAAHDPTIHYTLDFRVPGSCGFKLRFAHITEPLPLAVSAAYPAGTLIGHTIGNIPSGNWDIGWYDIANPGPLAKINAYGLHAHGLCLVDYYTPEKQAAYRARLTGPKLVCDF